MDKHRRMYLSPPGNGRASALLAGSAALHVAALAILGLNLTGREDRTAFAEAPPIYLDIEPRPLFEGEATRHAALQIRPTAKVSPGPTDRRTEDQDGFPPPPRPSEEPALPALAPAQPLEANPATEAFARALRNSALGCQLSGLSLDEQERCDRRLAESAARTAPIQGTSRPERDARFAAQGAQALARYEDKRRGLKPYSRAEACPGSPNPSDPCAVAIQGRIWSSRDGWFPDLPRPH